MTEYNIRLNPNCASVVHTGLKFKKGDKGITFKIAVDELDTAGTTAKIVFLRANGTSVESNISGTDGVYTYKTLGNEFAVPGKTVADVKFYSDGNRVSTASFMFEVSGDTMDGLGTGTSGYSDRLEQLVSEAEAAGKLTEQARTELEATEKDLETTEAEMAAVLQNFKEQYGEVGALNPRGDWKSDTTYQIRDTVYHNSSTWISLVKDNRKEPSDANKTHWMRSTDLQSIISGTTPAGNASKLGGLLPSEFVKIIDFGYTETDTKTAIGESGKVAIYRCVYWTDVPEAFPDAQATLITINYIGAGTAGVDQMWLRQFIISPNHEDIYSRYCYADSVSEWQKINDGGNADTVNGYHASELVKDYVSLPMGTDIIAYIDTDSNIQTDGYTSKTVKFRVLNSPTVPPIYGHTASDNDWYYEVTKLSNDWINIEAHDIRSNLIAYRNKNGGTWGEWTSNFLPLTGGTLEAPYNIALTLKNTASLWSLLKYEDTTGVLGHLGFSEKDKPIFVNADSTDYHALLHTGNVGSYALPITGGQCTGNYVGVVSLSSVKNRAILHAVDGWAVLRNRLEDNSIQDLGIINEKVYFLTYATDGTRKTISEVHHDGNSAKVVQATSAPSDTTAVWVDTANKVSKIYKDGAWTALA